jgi:hypothetical protein
MSMPVATYQCTACDYSCWDAATWGYRYYLYGESRVRMAVTLGWCHLCNGLAAVEVLPTALGEAERQQQLDALRIALHEELTASPTKRRWWQLHARKGTKQIRLESEIKSAEEDLAKYHLRRAALSNRTSQGRCLRCGAEECAPLPPHEKDYFDMASTPIPTGFTHPGCGGELVTICDGTRLNVRLTDKAYDLEGQLLP